MEKLAPLEGMHSIRKRPFWAAALHPSLASAKRLFIHCVGSIGLDNTVNYSKIQIAGPGCTFNMSLGPHAR